MKTALTVSSTHLQYFKDFCFFRHETSLEVGGSIYSEYTKALEIIAAMRDRKKRCSCSHLWQVYLC